MQHVILSSFHSTEFVEKRTIITRNAMSRLWETPLQIAACVMFAIVIALILASFVVSRRARVWAEEWMTHEYNGNVELSTFHVTIPWPLVQCEGENLALHFQDRQDLPPLIAVKKFKMTTSVWGLLSRSRRIHYLELDGFQVNIPPREERVGMNVGKNFSRKFRTVWFDEIVSENAIIRVLTKNPAKEPLEFNIERLRLKTAGPDDALEFHATLTNPRPAGEIVSSGLFGPWNPETPSLTPVSGNYDFEKADLSVFKGIAGILNSRGNYQGVLEKIQVDGTTDTPDFRLTRAGHAVDLSTSFHATVDGTDGDTYLQPVETHFGKSTLIAEGSVQGAKGQKGKTINLELSADRARIEALLSLAMRESPSMFGPVRLKAKFILTPGPQEIPDRLNLDGTFQLGSLHFSSGALQQKVDNLSKRSQGKPNEVVSPEEATGTDDVKSEMKGNFRLGKGILSLSELEFEVPGANVQLGGTYTLGPEILDMHGTVKMQAKLSQTTTGFKSFLLKFADPIFSKRGSGAVVPIEITGSVQHPHYGLDLRHRSEASTANR
jgi:AsmA-like protein